MPDTKPIKVSVIVPCYKVEKYLPACLDSLMAQTLDGVEAVCINDGSPDRCIDILRGYEARYPGKVTVIDKPNEGVWKGRRDGIAIARGAYIGFLDSDDWVEPTFCEDLWNCAQEFDADVAVCGFQREDAKTGEVLSVEFTNHREAFNVDECPERLLELNGAPWNKLFRAELLKDLPDLDHPPRILDDLMMHLLVYLQVKRVAFVPKSLVHYLIRDDSIMTTITQEQAGSTYQAMREVRALYDEQASEGLSQFLDAAAFLHLGVSLMFRVSCDPNADLKSALEENRVFLNDVFPTWRTSGMVSLANARRYGGAFTRLYISRVAYDLHLMGPFLGAYKALVASGNDVKW